MSSNEFAFAFMNARKASGLTQRELANKIGLTRQAVAKYEKPGCVMSNKRMHDWYEAMNDEGKKILDTMAPNFFTFV